MESPVEAAIRVRAACKTFKTNRILRSLNMTVPQGCIYGLLGPSGCGKTTLFKCILGRQQLDSGEITVTPAEQRSVGYMPQDLALHNEFSIQETLVYYGMLYGMSRDEISQRVEWLLQLLELPSKHKTVHNLSGGQKRRVSLCVALIHDPQLLFLDEPTVGVDIVLSRKMWDYLVHLTTVERKTIVITTHYIEEARRADMIGMMREGLLLAEQSPLALIETYNCDSLEQAFLRLSQQQANNLSTKQLQDSETYSPSDGHCKSPYNKGAYIRLHRLRAQMLKSYYWMKGNKMIMLFIVLLPAFCTYMFNLCIGNDPVGLPMGVYNEEVLSDEGCAQYPDEGCYLESQLSCRFLDRVRRLSTFRLTEFNSLDDGEKAINANIVWGVLHFSKNFTENYLERIKFSVNLNESVIEFGNIDVFLDMSNMYIGTLNKKHFFDMFISFQKELFRDCGWPEQLGDIPIRFNEPLFGDRNPNFKHYSGAPTVSLFSFFLPVMFTAAALLSDKVQGLLERSLVSGLSIVEVLLAHSVIQFVLILINTAIELTICYIIFDHPMIGNIYIFIGLIILIALTGMSFGFLVALVCDSDLAAATAGIGCFFSITLTSGVVWPREGMHYLLKAVTWLLPLTLPTEAYRAIASKAWRLSHPVVYQGFLTCFGWIAAFLLASYLTVRFKKGIGSK